MNILQNRGRIWGFLFLVALGGCALPNFPNASDAKLVDITFNEEVFSRGSKAVVVIDEYNDIPSSIKLHGLLTISDYEENEYNLNVDGVSVFMLNPGTYKLKNFKLQGTSGYWHSRIDYKDRYDAHFNIVGGEVVYLGKLNTKMLSPQFNQNQIANGRIEVITVTKVEDDLISLPMSFLGAIHKYTGKGLTSRIMTWRDSYHKRGKNE